MRLRRTMAMVGTVAALAATGCRERPGDLPEPRMPSDEAVRETGRDVGEALRTAGEKVEEAAEGVKEGVGGSGDAEPDRKHEAPRR